MGGFPAPGGFNKNHTLLFQNPPVEEVALVGSVRGLKKVDRRETAIQRLFYHRILIYHAVYHAVPSINRTALGCASMAPSCSDMSIIGVAQATGTATAAAVFVYVVSLYCGAGYLDLPFETSTSKVVLGIDFETDMRACFQAFHPNARVLNIDIGLHTVVGVIGS